MAEKGGFFKKWIKGFEKITTGVKEQFSLIWSSEKPKEEDWEGLEEMLIQADMGPQLAMDLVEGFRSFKQSSRGEGDWKEWLYTKLESVLAGNEPRLFPSFLPGEMCVILLVGINGVGKTTVAGKLAYMLAQNGEKVSLVAADTFRAAAMDQLEIWAQRAKCHLVKGSPGADPGAVVFDGIDAAHKRGSTVAIVDTAGRSHVNKNLLAELEKVGKIIMRLVPAENVENILVIDAMAGQNAFIQAESMGKAVPITGVILTKWDSQAKGGIVFRIRQELGFPLKYIGIGEKIEDVMLFDNEQFVQAVVYGEEFS